MTGENWGTQRHMMIHHYDESSSPELLILINMENVTIDFQLPEGRTWGRLIDTQAWFDTPTNSSEPEGSFSQDPTMDPFKSWNISLNNPYETEAAYGVQPFSIVVLEEQ